MPTAFLGLSLALLLAIAAPTVTDSVREGSGATGEASARSDGDHDMQFSSVDGGAVSDLDQFALELRELFDAPDADDAVAGNAEPVSALAGELVDRIGMSVDLPMPCGRQSSGETCMETAERLCWLSAGGQMTGFLAADGALYALRCDDGS